MDLSAIKTLYLEKQQALLAYFSLCQDPQSIYEKIIFLGKSLPKPIMDITQDVCLVQGCQSNVYLFSELTQEGNIFYHIHSDALISSGLAQLLLLIYQNEKVELTLFCPPLFIQELGLSSALSPGRSNGLASMYARMQYEAKKIFIQSHAKTSL